MNKKVFVFEQHHSKWGVRSCRSCSIVSILRTRPYEEDLRLYFTKIQGTSCDLKIDLAFLESIEIDLPIIF